MAERFGAMLRRHRRRAGLSQNKLARRAGIDPAYVNRMERAGTFTGSGRPVVESGPRRSVVRSLADVLDLDAVETDRLLFAAGLAPERDWQAVAEEALATLATIRAALALHDEPRALAPVVQLEALRGEGRG